MGMGFEARAAHPCPTQIWVPPGSQVIDLNFLKEEKEKKNGIGL